MANTLQVDIVSAEGVMFSGVADMLHASAENGEIGVLPKHTPFLSPIKPGSIKIDSGDEEEFFYVSGGIIEVQPDAVTVLADTVIRATELDKETVEKAHAQVEELLQSADSADIDVIEANARLVQSMAQIETVRKFSDNARKRGLMK